jgi:integrase
VADAWAFYWQHHGRGTRRAPDLEKLWRRHCQDIGARPLLELDVEQVQAWHDGIARSAPIVALHAYQALRAATRLCMKKPSASGWPKGFANPFSGVETRKARPRRRRLEGADLAAFGAAALEHPDVAVRTFLLALHVTGARVSELRLATIQQYDRARRVIEWPTSKNEDPRVLTLGPVTARLLEHVLGKRTTGLIWPGGCQDSGFDFRKAWAATCKAAGVTRYTFHDARRSFAEALASAGDPAFSDLRLEELLGHRLQGVQANYRYLDVHSPVRAKAAAAVEAALGLARRTEKPQVRRSK